MHDDNNKNSIASNTVGHVYEDKNGILWIATTSGISALNLKTDAIKNYTTEEGLPSNNILGILQDDTGNLWISTSKGLSRFNAETSTFKYFDTNKYFRKNHC